MNIEMVKLPDETGEMMTSTNDEQTRHENQDKNDMKLTTEDKNDGDDNKNYDGCDDDEDQNRAFNDDSKTVTSTTTTGFDEMNFTLKSELESESDSFFN